MNKYGWSNICHENYKSFDDKVIFRGSVFKYELPKSDGYYPSIGLYEIIYNKESDILFHNGNEDQIFNENEYSIQNYKSYFPEVREAVALEYMEWGGYRINNHVYIVNKIPTRQSIQPVFDLLTTYFRIQSSSEYDKFEHDLKNVFIEDINNFKALKIIQNVNSVRLK